MTHPDHDRDRDEPVTVTDKRRVDPKTGEVREGSPAGPAPNGPASGPFAGETPEEADKAAELLGDLQRVQADFANYRKRALRDQESAGERATWTSARLAMMIKRPPSFSMASIWVS